MKKIKEQKGITLVALIITIIVLLILAVVAIRAVQGDGIISHAKNARDEYAQKATEENRTLESYLEKIENNDPNNVKWKQNGTIVTNGTITLEVGDYINYNHKDVEIGKETSKTIRVDYGEINFSLDDIDKWQVLGAKNGNLLITSSDIINKSNFPLEYERLNLLDDICAIYGNGKGASEGKCITIEDINRVTKYDPNNIDGNGTKYGQGEIYEYENEITVVNENDKWIVRGSNGQEYISEYLTGGYGEIDECILGKSTFYTYSNMYSGSAYEMLFKDKYILNSTCINATRE